MRYRHRVLGFLFLLSIITYLDRVVSRSPARACRRISTSVQNSGDGWSGSSLCPMRLLKFRAAPWRTHRRAKSADAHRRVVVGVSRASRARFQLLVLLFVRFAFGAGEAGAYPGSSSAISRWFPTPNAAARMASCGWQAALAEHCLRCWWSRSRSRMAGGCPSTCSVSLG